MALNETGNIPKERFTHISYCISYLGIETSQINGNSQIASWAGSLKLSAAILSDKIF